MRFPEGFTWGVATASYQIEGAPYCDGGGYTVWDMFCRRPDKVRDSHNGDVACDHYHRYREDVALMEELEIPAYRLSISWPRVIPDGVGAVSEEGIGFYDRLIDGLLEAGVTPYVTLYHWDYPYELYCRGGWLNPGSPDWFADYTRVIVDRLSDRVQHWMTLNEPQCFIGLGHQQGIHAPGDTLGFAEILRAAHHTLLAHGRAVQVIRANSRKPAVVGYAPVGVTTIPLTDSPADIEAARSAMFSIGAQNCWNNTWWMDPVFFGSYPEDGLKLFGDLMPRIRPGEMETINQPLDFLGANIYNAPYIRAGENGAPETAPYPPGIGRTVSPWPVTPPCLYWGPRFFYERYRKPIIITENGLANTDWVALDGRVHDLQRIDFLARHLVELSRASSDGVDVRGYFQWSFMDNFEWAEGYNFRFGLIYVDYVTQQRIPKDSAYWYSEVIRSNGAALEPAQG